VASRRDLPPVQIERSYWRKGLAVAAIDEAGRGPLFGEVTVGAVVIDHSNLPVAFDSKTLSGSTREKLALEVRKTAVSYGVGAASAQEIDTLGMSAALALAATRALEQLTVEFDVLLIDGPHNITKASYRTHCIVKGETHSRSIAAASLIAKTEHDKLILEHASLFPGYGLERNMGYGTPEHLEALRSLGATPEHRHSFKPVREILRKSSGDS
jgi:ribonuclease HII